MDLVFLAFFNFIVMTAFTVGNFCVDSFQQLRQFLDTHTRITNTVHTGHYIYTLPTCTLTVIAQKLLYIVTSLYNQTK